MIGIVGGAGPFAGLDLCNKILEETVAEKDQDFLTVINLSQPQQILDRTEYLLGNVAQNPGVAIADQVQRMARIGAKVAAIPCNTAHSAPIYDLIVARLAHEQVDVNFLHMIRETAVFLQKQYPSIKKVGVLSTTGTYRAEIYPQFLQPAGFTVLVPDEVMQLNKIHPAIYDPVYGIKANGKSTQQARQHLLDGAMALKEQGAEALILGCTEIPLAIGETAVCDMIVIDPTRILARALIREANPKKLRPISPVLSCDNTLI